MYILTCQQMKEAEDRAVAAGGTYLLLMENAGKAVCQSIVRRENGVNGKRCVVLCGSGNNGGDGFVIARKLLESGATVLTVLVDGNPRSKEATEMYGLLYNKGASIERLGTDEDLAALNQAILDCDIIVDAVFGTGFRGIFPDRLHLIVQMANMSAGRIYAVDIPSGMEGDSGRVAGRCFEAYATVALGALKPAHIAQQTEEFLGYVEVAAIGIEESVFAALNCHRFLIDVPMAYAPLRKRPRYSNKGTFGKLLCICGSFGMTGAALLSGKAAYRSGAGLVYMALSESQVPILYSEMAEAIAIPLLENKEYQALPASLPLLFKRLEEMSAAVIGCGIGTSLEAEEIVCEVVQNSPVPLVVDADALNILSHNKEVLRSRKADLVLTPHPGEMAKLLGASIPQVLDQREEIASQFAEDYHVTVILKGANTIVASSEGDLYMNSTGNPGLAKAGSGDLLAGTIGGLIAQGISPLQAAVSGVYLHGMAADLTADRLSQYSMMASDVLEDYPKIFKPCDRN